MTPEDIEEMAESGKRSSGFYEPPAPPIVVSDYAYTDGVTPQMMTRPRRLAWDFVESELGDGLPHRVLEIHAKAKAAGFQRRTLDFALYRLCRVRLDRSPATPWTYTLPYRLWGDRP